MTDVTMPWRMTDTEWTAVKAQLLALGGAEDVTLHAPEGVIENADMANHAEASALMLERLARQIRDGQSPQDIGPMVELVGRIMARRT